MENKGYSKFGGQEGETNKVHYGRCTSGVQAIMYLVYNENFA